MPEGNKLVVQRFFEEMCNGRKLEIAEALFHANHVYHDPASPWVGAGPEGMKQLISAYQTAFPDAEWTVHEVLSSGSTVITRWTGTGTHKRSLQGLTATGRGVNVTGIWMHRFAGGKIIESWNHWDMLGMLQQLGAAPLLAQRRAAV